MKLRIKGDSVRLRLTRSEVETFSAAGSVCDALAFGDSGRRFVYLLESSPDAVEITATFDGGVIRVLVPATMAADWAGTEKVGIESSDDHVPRILVEKDFVCLAPRRGEDETDMFPNPQETNCSPNI